MTIPIEIGPTVPVGSGAAASDATGAIPAVSASRRSRRADASPTAPRGGSRRRARARTSPAAPETSITRDRTWLHAFRRGIAWGFFSLMTGIGVAAIVIPTATGSTPLAVLTGSMAPSLPPGTLVVVRPTPVDQIRLGDVITYQLEPGNPVVVSHRVVEVHAISDGGRQFITQGDNNPARDPNAVRAEQVMGVIWYSLPVIGWVSIGFGQYAGWLMPLAGAALVLYGGILIVSGARGRRARPTLRRTR